MGGGGEGRESATGGSCMGLHDALRCWSPAMWSSCMPSDSVPVLRVLWPHSTSLVPVALQHAQAEDRSDELITFQAILHVLLASSHTFCGYRGQSQKCNNTGNHLQLVSSIRIQDA